MCVTVTSLVFTRGRWLRLRHIASSRPPSARRAAAGALARYLPTISILTLFQALYPMPHGVFLKKHARTRRKRDTFITICIRSVKRLYLFGKKLPEARTRI